ncbi:MAG: hypothetical protein H7Y42_13940 [Chitinophagaceae bacterium]|nr:hypothetical protein [Chitinophagaceae bacterium]
MRGRPKKIIPLLDRDALIAKFLEQFKQGYSDKYIAMSAKENPACKFTDEQVLALITEAREILMNEHSHKPADIKLLHVARRNRMTAKLLATKELDADLVTSKRWLDSRNRKIRASSKALELLSAIESLLEISFERNTTVEVLHEVNVSLNSPEKSNLYVTRLTFDEQLELYHMMLKAKVGRVEPVGVREIDYMGNIIEDIEAEVLPTNVEHIKLINAPVDSTTERTSSDPTLRLRERLKALAAKKFHQVGAHLDDTEQKYFDQ